MLVFHHSAPHVFRIIIKGYQIFSRTFLSASLELIVWFLFLILCLTEFVFVEPSLRPQSGTAGWLCYLSALLWNSTGEDRHFCLHSLRKSLQHLFSLLIWFGYQTSHHEFSGICTLLFYGKGLRIIDVNSGRTWMKVHLVWLSFVMDAFLHPLSHCLLLVCLDLLKCVNLFFVIFIMYKMHYNSSQFSFIVQ